MLRRRTSVYLIMAAAVAGALAIALPGSASAVTVSTTVWVPVSSCATPAAGHSSCFAQRLVKRTVRTTAARAASAAASGLQPGFGNGPAGGFAPNEIAKAYGFTANAPTTQTVAIVDAYRDPSVLSDLNAFDNVYGLAQETSSSFKIINQTGGADVSSVATSVDWSTEIALDVDTVRGLCNKCKIILVEANTNDNGNLGAGVNAAVAAGAKIVSNSYGGPENDSENNATVKADYDHHGVAVLASSGDDGWYSWDVSNAGCPASCTTAATADLPNTPASYNSVVGVGGTSLFVNSNGTRNSDQVWNENGQADLWGYNLGAALGASGSGCSTQFAPQAWQAHVSGYSALGCGAARNGVDIAAVADPYTGYDTFETTTSWCTPGGKDGINVNCPSTNPGWETWGGTSLASPAIAAMWALAGGPAGVTYPALSLYGHFKSTAGSTNDVTVGGTGACDWATPGSCAGGTNPNGWVPGQDLDCGWSTANINATTYTHAGQCYALPGYDGVSGVGTPKGLTVFKAMNPTAKITHSGTVTHGHSASFSGASSTDPFPGGSISSYSWNWGDGRTSTGKTASHTYGSKGTRTITLKVTDNYGRTGTATLKITIK